jgi:hypothetical protein
MSRRADSSRGPPHAARGAGRRAEILLRTVRAIEQLVTRDPCRKVAGEPGIKLYVVFLSRRPGTKRTVPLASLKAAP